MGASAPGSTVAIRLRPGEAGPILSFGIEELRNALRTMGYSLTDADADIEIVAGRSGAIPGIGNGAPEPAERPEAYSITWASARQLALTGSDQVGAMYACLDVGEQVAMGAELREIEAKSAEPELAVRGIYTFLHNAEAERGWLYDPTYWQAYADELARWRYNRFNLIFGHQTAHLIPIYSHLLDDLDTEFLAIRVEGITSEERARNLRALQTASEAMTSHGIAFCLGIWQSRPWTVAGGAREDQPTRVRGTEDLRRLARYTRVGFTRLIERCPAIGGIQLRMNVESGVADQRFFVEAFVPALRDLAARGRPLKVELRNWALQPSTIEAFRAAGVDIVVSTKYFAEHHGLPYQPPVMRGSYSYDSFLRSDRPFPFQWHLWNLGSHRLFVWGDPDYARRFVRSCHLGDGIGFEVTPPGSQKGFSQWGQVSPGDWQPRADLPARWDFDRFWFFHMAFGRLGYDSTLWYAPFVHELNKRTSPEAAPALLAAYRAASRIVSYLISMRMDDPNMYVWPELDCGGPIDHNSVARPGEVTLFTTAREHAADRLAGRPTAKRSPFDAAWDLERYASGVEEALAQLKLEPIPSLADNLEFRTIETDFQALRALARYHASKCRATGNLALFYASGERHYLDAAERAAEAGVRRWEELCARTEVYHHALHYGPSGGHWRDNRPRVEYDLRRVRRVRELFDAFGLFTLGFDFGQPYVERVPTERIDPRFVTGLDPEPRFIGVDRMTRFSPERGHGWLQTGGLGAVGPTRPPRRVIWGVHFVKPGEEYDPADIEAMPLDGLTGCYLTAGLSRTFRIDLPKGEHEVALIAPRHSILGTPVRLDDGSDSAELAMPLSIGGAVGETVRSPVRVANGALRLEVGGNGPWALAGVVVRPLGPMIAHLPPIGTRGDQDLTLTATATAVEPIRTIILRYSVAGERRELTMAGDGSAFRAAVPSADLGDGPGFEYSLLAEDEAGRRAERGPFRIPVVRDFRPPRVLEATVPESWRSGADLALTLTLEHGAWVREARLHYREADQNREFRLATIGGGSDECGFLLDTSELDDAYELLAYFEVIDVFGRGFFYPDPLEQARYYVVKPEPSA